MTLRINPLKHPLPLLVYFISSLCVIKVTLYLSLLLNMQLKHFLGSMFRLQWRVMTSSLELALVNLLKSSKRLNKSSLVPKALLNLSTRQVNWCLRMFVRSCAILHCPIMSHRITEWWELLGLEMLVNDFCGLTSVCCLFVFSIIISL